MAISCIISYVCVRNIVNMGEEPFNFRIWRINTVVFTSKDLVNKVILCVLDLAQVAWCFFGIISYFSSDWSHCLQVMRSMTLMVPIFSFFGLLVLFRMGFVIFFFMCASCVEKRFLALRRQSQVFRVRFPKLSYKDYSQ